MYMMKHGYIQVDSQESSRKLKKAEILENLTRLYPGVVSRGGTCVHLSLYFVHVHVHVYTLYMCVHVHVRVHVYYMYVYIHVHCVCNTSIT